MENAPVTAPPVCIYHQNCHDGFAAAWLFWRLYRSAEFIPAQYGDDPPVSICSGRDVVIADFSYPLEGVRAIQAVANSLTILDHHKTARDTLQHLEDGHGFRIVFDMERSGARLMYDFLRDDRGGSDLQNWIVDYVEDRDLWRWALPHSRAINAYLRTVPFRFEAWEDLWEDGRQLAQDHGCTILEYQNIEIDLGKQNAGWTVCGGSVVPIVNCTSAAIISDLVGQLAEGHPFAMSFFVRANGECVYSLRSRGEQGFDVARIAEMYGGGGHRNAAGFNLSLSTLPIYATEREAQAEVSDVAVRGVMSEAGE